MFPHFCLSVVLPLVRMKSLLKKCVLLVFIFILTITCSNGRTIENTTSTGTTINSNSESNISVNDDSNGVTNKSGISVNNESNIVSSNNNETTIDNNNSNNTINDETLTENIISISNNSNTVDNETIIISSTTNDSENNKVVICYFKSWGLYKKGLAKYTPENINTSLCTHIYYAFAKLDNETLTITFMDKNADIYKGFYKKITALADRGIKPILSLGGWGDSKGDKYSRLVNNATARANFVNKSIDFLTMYKFQGLDIDWEYPVCWQGKCNASAASDKENFGNLVKELSEAYKPLGLHLSAAVAPGPWLIKKGYDVPVLGRYLDYIGLMTYDIHSYRQGRTGAHSPLLGVSGVVQSLLNWEKAGAPRSKLVVGFPTDAKTYTLKNPEEHGLGAPTVGPGTAGNHTRAKGTLSYYEMCYNIFYGNWTTVQTEGNGSYAYLDDQWGSYVNVKDSLERIDYIKTNDYAGALVWAVDMDDFHNMCGCGANPLLTAVNSIRYTDVQIPDCP